LNKNPKFVETIIEKEIITVCCADRVSRNSREAACGYCSRAGVVGVLDNQCRIIGGWCQCMNDSNTRKKIIPISA